MCPWRPPLQREGDKKVGHAPLLGALPPGTFSGTRWETTWRGKKGQCGPHPPTIQEPLAHWWAEPHTTSDLASLQVLKY